VTSIGWEDEAMESMLALARTDYRQARRIFERVYRAHESGGDVINLKGYRDR
jgi:hypothetical protein